MSTFLVLALATASSFGCGQSSLLAHGMANQGAALLSRQASRDPVALVRADQSLLPKDLADQRFALMTASPHAFFRATTSIFARDAAKAPGFSSGLKLRIQGDAHLENLGSVPLGQRIVFGPNDMDESCIAPLSYELARVLASIQLAAQENGQDGDRLATRFLASYVIEAKAGAKGLMKGPAAQAIRNAEAAVQNREDWIKPFIKDHAFEPNRRNLPLPAAEEASLKAALAGYAALRREGPSFYRVKDAKRRLAGLGSFGRPRYWVLLEGPSDAKKDDVILDIKSASAPAWAGVAGVSGTAGDPAKRVVESTQAFLQGGDPFLGALQVGGTHFVVRERSPSMLGEVPLKDLKSPEAWSAFIDDAAAAYAAAHVRVGAKASELAAEAQAKGPSCLAFAKAYPSQVAQDLAAVKGALR